MKNERQNTKNEAWIISRKKLFLESAAVIVSAILYATAFPPLNWSFFAWVAVMPLYLVISKKSPIKAFFWGLLWGYIWAVISFFWLREIEFFIPYVMAFILGLYPAFWAFFVPFFRRNILIPVSVQLKGSEAENSYRPSCYREILFILSIACLWSMTEWVRSWMATGLPWNFAGTSQWKNISLIQVCEYTGVYGLSFIIIFLNIALAFTLIAIKDAVNTGKYRRPISLAVALLFFLVAILAGLKPLFKYRIIKRDESDKNKKEYVTFNAAVIQGNIAQCRFPKPGVAERALNTYIELSELAIMNHPDIVIWSETAVPYPYADPYRKFSQDYRDAIEDLLQKFKKPILIGTIDRNFNLLIKGVPYEELPSYNSAFLLDLNSSNKYYIVDKYNKIHLVPWGEYTPLGEYYPQIKKAFGMGRDLASGTKYTIFEPKKDVKTGVNICFEDVFPEISANFAKSGANLLLVITNDAWYPKSSEPEQHLANSVFRAVETRRPMIRVGNNNCSCLILPNGLIADSITVKADGSLDIIGKSEGFGNFNIDILKNPKLTFYTKYPYAFILFCSFIVLAAILYSIWSWKEKKKFFLDKFESKN